MRSSSTRPSSIAAAASPAPPIETSLFVTSSAAAASAATDASASRVALNAAERTAKHHLRDRAPHVGERRPKLVAAQRRIHLPHQHRLVKPAAQQIAAEPAYLRNVETKPLLTRHRPPKRALPAGDKAVHRDTHRIDQHGFKLIAPQRPTMTAMTFTIELDTGLSNLLQSALPPSE
jgi:hypothetical protein